MSVGTEMAVVATSELLRLHDSITCSPHASSRDGSSGKLPMLVAPEVYGDFAHFPLFFVSTFMLSLNHMSEFAGGVFELVGMQLPSFELSRKGATSHVVKIQ